MISIQKIIVLFVDCTRSCMLHYSYLVKEFVVSVSNVDEVSRIVYSCFFLLGHQNLRNQMLTNAAQVQHMKKNTLTTSYRNSSL